MPPSVRPFAASDSVEDLTDLIHRAFARLGAMGLNYTAVDQPAEVTRRRIQNGQCFLTHVDGLLAGTVTLQLPRRHQNCAWYSRPDVAVAHQLAVEPTLQGRGIGSALMAFAENWALQNGCRELALDTAIPAAHLVRFYTRRGYRQVEEIRHSGKSYASVVLSKALAQAAAAIDA